MVTAPPVDTELEAALAEIAARGRANPHLVAKMTDEAVTDPKALASYRARHGGLTPIEVIARKYPQLRAAMELMGRNLR